LIPGKLLASLIVLVALVELAVSETSASPLQYSTTTTTITSTLTGPTVTETITETQSVSGGILQNPASAYLVLILGLLIVLMLEGVVLVVARRRKL